MVTATGSIRASGAHAATTPTRPKTIRPQPDAHETSPCSRAFSSASLMHLCSGKRCNLAPALTDADRYKTLDGKFEYFDLRELQDTITGKEPWVRFEPRFGTKEALNVKFDQLAE